MMSLPPVKTHKGTDNLGGRSGGGYLLALAGDGQVLFRFDAPAEPGNSLALASIRGFEGDGQDVLLVGAPLRSSDGRAQCGALFALSSRGEVLYRIDGAKARDGLGFSLCTVGDVDGDGVPDVVVGAVSKSGLLDVEGAVKKADSGYILALSGRTGNVIARIDPPHAGRWFGSAVAATGDVDGDGVGDYAVSQPYGRLGGTVFIYSGKDSTLMRTIQPTGADADEHFGLALVGLPWTGMGSAHVLVVGTPSTTFGGGHISVFSARSGDVARSIKPPGGVLENLGFGIALARYGDTGQVLAGAAVARAWRERPGRLHLIDVSTGELQWTLDARELR